MLFLHYFEYVILYGKKRSSQFLLKNRGKGNDYKMVWENGNSVECHDIIIRCDHVCQLSALQPKYGHTAIQWDRQTDRYIYQDIDSCTKRQTAKLR